MSSNLITDPFIEAQTAIRVRLDEILDACRSKDFDRLAGYHLSGPKFSKFDDEGPQGRQDDKSGMQGEIDAFSALEDFDGGFDDLKIDVFGPVAVVTGVFRCTFTMNGEIGSARSRTSAVFVDNEGDWVIAHEHNSPLISES
jgi:ketosteroid isomerase-like protein